MCAQGRKHAENSHCNGLRLLAGDPVTWPEGLVLATRACGHAGLARELTPREPSANKVKDGKVPPGHIWGGYSQVCALRCAPEVLQWDCTSTDHGAT